MCMYVRMFVHTKVLMALPAATAARSLHHLRIIQGYFLDPTDTGCEYKIDCSQSAKHYTC